MRRLGIVGIALAAGIGQALVAQNTGVISGTVLDEKGKTYSEGARVMIVKAPERPDGFEPFAASVIAGKDGKYRVANLAPGKYELCLTTFGTEYVDVCQWGRPAGTVFITVAAAVISKNLSLEKGKIFTIDLKDDDGYMERHEGKSTGGFLNVGVVTDKKEFVLAEVANSSKISRKYRVVVPVGAKFRVRAMGPLFDLKGENEAALSLRVLQDMDQVIEAQDTTKGVILKVGGVKALEGAK